MTEPEALGPDRLKHLEFIQAVITRCATTSFVIKGWTLSIVAAVLALVAKQIDPSTGPWRSSASASSSSL